MTEAATDPTPITRLTRDIAQTGRLLDEREVRMLVTLYYDLQKLRVGTSNRVRQYMKDGRPAAVLDWYETQSRVMEKQLVRPLGDYALHDPLGEWSLGIKGIGPVLAAGLLATFDWKRPTPGHLHSFAGLVPGQKWEKGQRRPWSSFAKTLCWKIGESFVKVSGRDGAFYGALYAERKAMEIERNEAGQNACLAAKRAKEVGKDTDAYKAYSTGKLPPAHIHRRATRWTSKLFLSHWWEVGQRLHGLDPSPPYAISHLGHVHQIAPPNWPVQ